MRAATFFVEVTVTLKLNYDIIPPHQKKLLGRHSKVSVKSENSYQGQTSKTLNHVYSICHSTYSYEVTLISNKQFFSSAPADRHNQKR